MAVLRHFICMSHAVRPMHRSTSRRCAAGRVALLPRAHRSVCGRGGGASGAPVASPRAPDRHRRHSRENRVGGREVSLMVRIRRGHRRKFHRPGGPPGLPFRFPGRPRLPRVTLLSSECFYNITAAI